MLLSAPTSVGAITSPPTNLVVESHGVGTSFVLKEDVPKLSKVIVNEQYGLSPTMLKKYQAPPSYDHSFAYTYPIKSSTVLRDDVGIFHLNRYIRLTNDVLPPVEKATGYVNVLAEAYERRLAYLEELNAQKLDARRTGHQEEEDVGFADYFF